MKCLICDEAEMLTTWTDTHGIAQCVNCGTPYQIYHYEDGKRVDKPVECLIADDWVERIRGYWNQHKRKMPSGYGFVGGQEVASAEDAELFNSWLEIQ